MLYTSLGVLDVHTVSGGRCHARTFLCPIGRRGAVSVNTAPPGQQHQPQVVTEAIFDPPAGASTFFTVIFII
ncbi:hypothetical protein [Streptomyces gilvosporeus]|uniref:hypothetical protein n=1 Tax=Streptomyces gilvosporeus TaxID=553510 RepID=UPI001396B62F|nr:hypothetical protein [Streptomyces gilvosporeus]